MKRNGRFQGEVRSGTEQRQFIHVAEKTNMKNGVQIIEPRPMVSEEGLVTLIVG